jgi:hypothetical protein
MSELGRSLIMFGAVIVLIGLGIMLWGRFGTPRLPGDIVIRRGGTTFYFPIVTSIVASIVLTILVNLIFRRK